VKTAIILGDFIRTPSVNPAFLPEGHPHAGEGKMADLLFQMGRKAGFDCERQNVSPGRDNVLVRLIPSGPVRKRIWLVPHMDTVGASDAQLKPRTVGDKLYGRGACDTKGSIAAMFCAMCDLAASGKDRPQHTEIMLAALVDEENCQRGSRHLAASGLRADLAVVGEPTMNQVVTAHKGNLWISLQTRGVAAHGSRPELGKNAIHEMSQIVDVLETTYAAQLRKRRHKVLGCGTVNVGAIHGGKQPNIVPDHCAIEIDRRTLPGETERSVRAEIKALLSRKGLKAEFSMAREEECVALETDHRKDLVAQLLGTVGQKKPIGVNYFCDASVLSRRGTPSVVFGPGDIAQAHTADEWISIRSLEKCRELLRTYLSALP
jgi:acetylornithine deacetylase/succinyl-diaminopimelate desuccinylase-like protein